MLRAALVTPLTGPLAEYGQAGAHALRLWAQRYNELRTAVRLQAYDAHPDPSAALHTANADAPHVLFGPYGSQPMREVAHATSRLIWNHGAAAYGEDLSNIVHVLAPARTYFDGLLSLLTGVDSSLAEVCILHRDRGFARSVADGAVDSAQQLGLRTVRRSFPDDPPAGDVLLVAGHFDEELGAAQRLLPGNWRAAGFVGAGVDEVLADLGPRREGLLGPAQWAPGSSAIPSIGPSAQQFVDDYRAVTGAEPPYPAAQAFASGLIAARCLRDAGTTDESVLLETAKNLECTTFFGHFCLSPSDGRQVGQQVVIVQWQDGARRIVWPRQQAEVPLRHPLVRAEP